MTRRFIPDENVIILAQKQQDDRGAADLTCFQLVRGILDNPRAFIGVDYPLWSRYQSQLNRLPPHSIVPPPLLRRLNGADIGPPNRAGQWVYKVTLLPNAPAFPEESNIRQRSQDDVPVVVRLAVATRATLVTTDNRLIADLQDSGIAEKYGLQVVPPEEALNLL